MSAMLRSVFLFILVHGLLAVSAMAQTSAPAPSPAPTVRGANLPASTYNPLTTFQMWACFLCVLIGILVFAGQFLLLWKAKSLTADDIVKNCTITLVIVGALILIVAGYNSQQAAQAFGLFGTIIGYLLGRSAAKSDQATQDRKQD